MAQKKGQTGNRNGRPKGTPNKSTNELRNTFQSLLEANLETMQKDLDSLDPKDRLQIIFKMAAFCLPTLQSQSIDLNNESAFRHSELMKKFFNKS